MELLYVWVEEYGNIRRQGFNFSPNYDFEVKEKEKGEYILVDNFETSGKKKQPENFFGEKISNITAIVGKNGSGKSTLIDFLHMIGNSWYFNDDGVDNHKFLVVGYNLNKVCIKYWLGFENELRVDIVKESNIKKVEVTKNSLNNYRYRIESIHDEFAKSFNNFHSITYADIIEKLNTNRISQNNQTNYDLNISSNFLLKRIINQTNNEIDRVSDFENKETLKILTFFKSYYTKFKLFKLPKKLYIRLNKKEFYQWKSLVNDKPLHKATELFEKITNEIDKVDLSNETNENFKIELLYIMLLIFIDTESYILFGYKNYQFEFKLENFQIDSKPIDCLWSILDSFNDVFLEKLENIKEVEKIVIKLGNNYGAIKEKLSYNEQKIIEEFNVLNKPIKIGYRGFSLYNAIEGKKSIESKIKKINEFRNFMKELFEKIDISFKVNGNLTLELHSKNEFWNLEYFEKFRDKINLYSKNDKYPIFLYNFDIHLSSGEEKLITMFSRIYYLKQIEKRIKGKSIIFLLDEPDIYLHPEWQRLFISYFKGYIESLFSKEYSIQIILTSHSPFVASDLPRENVIMLDTNKDGNCVVKNDKKDKNIKTFGANIFDLYTDAFFVESSFGEFAKRKIKEVVEWLKYEEKKDETGKITREYNDDIIQSNKEQIEYILNSIGEPLVKNKLQKMYDEYTNYGKDENTRIEIVLKKMDIPKDKMQKILEAIKDD